eukprot:746790-Hanusia_phi.AAC.2
MPWDSSGETQNLDGKQVLRTASSSSGLVDRHFCSLKGRTQRLSCVNTQVNVDVPSLPLSSFFRPVV